MLANIKQLQPSFGFANCANNLGAYLSAIAGLLETYPSQASTRFVSLSKLNMKLISLNCIMILVVLCCLDESNSQNSTSSSSPSSSTSNSGNAKNVVVSNLKYTAVRRIRVGSSTSSTATTRSASVRNKNLRAKRAQAKRTQAKRSKARRSKALNGRRTRG
ncbi:uncharacterized protein [Drosophila pseudoobscura]|uniref:Uncharacterized protein n=2 Tax=pseudoobscura subgroup TaxID=32358 RepID=A0A6I8V5J9_DROPS|nr:uncharacterized protein LOC6898451 [Drosophila pseudoobscura]